MTRAEAEEEIMESNPKALFMDGFDEAIIGIASRPNLGPLIVYDEDKIIQKLITEMEVDEADLDGRTVEEVKYEMALDYYGYNIQSTWVGEGTPLIIKTTYE